MSRLTLKTAETIEVELFDVVYTSLPVTRSRELAIGEIREQLVKLNPSEFESLEDANRASVELVCSLADHVLQAPDGAEPASKVLLDAYLTDRVTFAAIEQLLDDIADEVAVRPT